MAPAAPIRTLPTPITVIPPKDEPVYKDMDSEIAALIAKTPDTKTYPSRELIVANAYIAKHPEYEKSRTEVYVSYVRVYEKMRKEGKLPEQIPAPATPAAEAKKPPAGKPNAAPKQSKPSATVKPKIAKPPASEAETKPTRKFIELSPELYGEKISRPNAAFLEQIQVMPKREELIRLLENYKALNDKKAVPSKTPPKAESIEKVPVEADKKQPAQVEDK